MNYEVRPLTCGDLEDIFDKENPGLRLVINAVSERAALRGENKENLGRRLLIHEILEWAETRPDMFYIHPENDTFHLRRTARDDNPHERDGILPYDGDHIY